MGTYTGEGVIESLFPDGTFNVKLNDGRYTKPSLLTYFTFKLRNCLSSWSTDVAQYDFLPQEH